MNKHIELLKKIPCGNFGVSKLFFDAFKKKAVKDISVNDVIMAYYYLSTEIMDDVDLNSFIVKKNPAPFNEYDCHDSITHQHIYINEYKPTKLYSSVIEHYYNRRPKRRGFYHGLVPTPKQKENIDNIIEDFKIFADLYKTHLLSVNMFTREPMYDVGEKELNHLYYLLKQLYTRADFQYKQIGSIILAQEMANVMTNHNIIKNNQHTPNGVEYVHKHKMLMFGELQR